MARSRVSAGLLLYRRVDSGVEVLLGHPGGPYFEHRDDGCWTIPKGEAEPDEDLLVTARREFAEETGLHPAGPFLALGNITQKAGKVVHAWGCEGDCDPGALVSNLFTMEWPPQSGQFQKFPELDRFAFLSFEAARRKIGPAQQGLVNELERLLGGGVD